MVDYKISVVIPAYNAGKHIGEALQSVLEQEYPAKEIIIVDDGSTDKTKEIVKQYSVENITYLFQQNAGPSKARNSGILRSSGDFIAFLDADDVWYPNHLMDAVTFFSENANVFWFSSAFNIEIYKKKVKTRVIKTQNSVLDFFNYTLRKSFLHTSAVVINREVFKNVGFFNENWTFGEDLNLWVRIALQYPNIGYCKNPGSVFRKTQDSLTFNKTNYDLKNTLKVLYFTNKEVEAAGNKKAIKLINQWIEDAVYSAILSNNTLVLNYIKKRWGNRIGVLTRLILFTHNIFPLIFIKSLNIFNKMLRTQCKILFN